MNSNITSNQENTNNQTKTEWQAPVLYKEDWMNTMIGTDPGPEATSDAQVS